MMYKESLRKLCFFSLWNRKLRGDFISVHNYLTKACKEKVRHASEVHKGRMRSDGHRLEHRKFQVDERRKKSP